jgi:hypothetical protein
MASRMKRDVPFALFAGAVLWSCSSSNAWLGDVPKQTPPLVSGDASDLDSGTDAANALMCIATSCPDPYTTCPSKFGPTYACAVDLRRDKENCGACGNECLTFLPLHMTSRCVESKCELECLSLPRPAFPSGFWPTNYKNCNGLLDDGCESDLFTDTANCGACGNACAAGQPCVNGMCGCPPGLDACWGFCVDLKTNDQHCDACGERCDDPAVPCDPMPANTYYGCVGGGCEKLKCQDKFADCNDDLGLECASDGCETYLVDNNHCGRCNKVCKADEECRDENDVIDCRPSCEKSGKGTCPDGRCVDILTDPDSCGGCGLFCPPTGPRQQRTCSQGVCVATCAAGYGDCNGDPSDGCETNLNAHPSNCGACGVSCDIAGGQPCVEGKCLMKPCDESEAR